MAVLASQSEYQPIGFQPLVALIPLVPGDVTGSSRSTSSAWLSSLLLLPAYAFQNRQKRPQGALLRKVRQVSFGFISSAQEV